MFVWIAIVVIGLTQCDIINKLDHRVEVLEQQGSDVDSEEQPDTEAPDSTGSGLHDDLTGYQD